MIILLQEWQGMCREGVRGRSAISARLVADGERSWTSSQKGQGKEQAHAETNHPTRRCFPQY
jgi:hypothetical protein